MFSKMAKLKLNNACQEIKQFQEQFVALRNSVPLMEYDTNGNILSANQYMLDMFQFESEELISHNEQMLWLDEYQNSNEYHKLWEDLLHGKCVSGTFAKKGKNGDILWLESSYCPVKDQNNTVYKVIEISFNVTEKKFLMDNKSAVIDSLDRSFAVIEFTPSGEILTANNIFLKLMQYDLNEVLNKHHRMFCSSNFLQRNIGYNWFACKYKVLNIYLLLFSLGLSTNKKSVKSYCVEN